MEKVAETTDELANDVIAAVEKQAEEDAPEKENVDIEISGAEVQEYLLKRIDEDYQYAKNERMALESEVNESRRLFNMEFLEDTKKKFPGAVFIGKATAIIYRLISLILTAYFERKALARVAAAHPRGTTPVASKIATKLLQHHLRRSIKSYLVLEDAVMDAAVDGDCWVKMGWKRKVHRYTDPDTGEEKEELEENRPFAEVLPWEDAFPDPDAVDNDSMRFFIHEKEIDLDYARRKASIPVEEGGWMNVDKLIQVRQESQEGRTTAPGNREREPFYIREYYGSLQLLPDELMDQLDAQGVSMPETLPVDVIATCYEDKVLLRLELNTYGRIPVFCGRLLKRKNRGLTDRAKTIRGKSVIALLKELVREWNLTRNQRLKYQRRALAGRIILGRMSGVNLRQLRSSEDGGVVYAEDATQVRDFKLPPLTPDADMGIMDEDFQEISGVPRGVQGLSPRGKQTATAFAGTMSQAMNRIGHMVQVFNLTLLEPMMEFLMDMVVKWEDPERARRIAGSIQPLPPLEDVFDHELETIIEAGVSTLTPEQQLQQVQMAMQVVGQYLPLDPSTGLPVMRALTKKILDLLPMEDIEQVWDTVTQAHESVPPRLLREEAAPPESGGNGAGGESGRPGTFSARGQPPARPAAPRPVMPGQVQGGMNAPGGGGE